MQKDSFGPNFEKKRTKNKKKQKKQTNKHLKKQKTQNKTKTKTKKIQKKKKTNKQESEQKYMISSKNVIDMFSSAQSVRCVETLHQVTFSSLHVAFKVELLTKIRISRVKHQIPTL